MSDDWLQLVPTDPQFQPTPEASRHAVELFASFCPKATEIEAQFYDTLEFIHPAANWSGVNCPACGADAQEWWSQAMEVALPTKYATLQATAGCCGAQVSLNEMHYVWPAAFGRYALSAMNPDVRDLSPEQEKQLADCLGCNLKAVWAHI